MATYQVFVRSWWKIETDLHSGLKKKVPHLGRKTILGYEDLEKAKAMCEDWNRNNDEGPTGRKCEFTSDY